MKRKRVYKRRYYYNGKRCSKGEKRIAVILEENNIIFEQEKSFNSCRSPKNRLLRFDFYLPAYNILIEYQGNHHYAPINKYRKAKLVHEKTVIHDKIKKEFIKKHNIIFLEIHYKEYNQIQNIIETILGER